VVTNTRKVLYTTAADEHDRVLLQVVSFTGDVSVDLFSVAETYTSNLTHSGVRFLRGSSVNPKAYATLLRASIQSARL